MKTALSIVLFNLIFVVRAYAQLAPTVDDNEWTALFEWIKQPDGLYKKISNHKITKKKSKINVISLDKAQNMMYAYDDYGCYYVKMQPNWTAYIKREYKKEKLDVATLKDELARIENNIDSHYNTLNEEIKQKQIVKEKRNNELLQKRRNEQLDNYRLIHKDWHEFPVKQMSKSCLICDKHNLDCVFMMRGDTIFTTELRHGYLNSIFFQVHAFIPTPSELSQMKIHIDAYKDSIENVKSNTSIGDYIKFNEKELTSYFSKLEKEAPDGFCIKWGWDANYPFSMSFNFDWQNMNKSKTIRYIEVYFRVKNAVGDILKTGSFKGTGPVKPLDYGSWNWEHSQYVLPGDASNAEITKIIITWMDKTKKTLMGKQIVFN